MLTLPELLRTAGADAAWAPELAGVETELRTVLEAVAERRAHGEDVLPAADRVLAALTGPPERVRVIILGQDPYPTPGHALGLAFAAARTVRPLPRSLANISRELVDDLGVAPLPHADLRAWSAQGVLLLNRVLTVTAGAAGSHRRAGWEEITAHLLRRLGARRPAPVAILWGADAARAAEFFPADHVLRSAHPSPLSARRGFFGSRPFSAANTILQAEGQQPISWEISDENALEPAEHPTDALF